MRNLKDRLSILVALVATSCAPAGPSADRPGGPAGAGAGVASLDALAPTYLELVHGAWSADPLPAEIYGPFGRVPPAIAAAAGDLPPDSVRAQIDGLRRSLGASGGAADRRRWLDRHLVAMDARLGLLAGEHMSLERQMEHLFDLEVAPVPVEHLATARGALERLLPGQGGVAERFLYWNRRVTLRPAQIERAAPLILAETRRRTRAALELPAGESVELVLEDEAPYGGWAEYRGQGRTILHINTSRRLQPDWLVHLIAHEGYPGHHVQLTLLDRAARDYPELAALPPLSPTLALIEGGADAAARAIWPEAELQDWVVDELFPELGIEVDVPLWRRVRPHIETVLAARLNVPFMLARGIPPDSVARFLEHYGLMPSSTAQMLVEGHDGPPFLTAFDLINAKHSPAANLVFDHMMAGGAPLERYARLYMRPTLPSSLER